MIESEKEIFEREWNKMLSGEVYDAVNPRFIEMLMTTRDKLWEFNNLRPYEMDKMKDILRGLLGSHGKNFHVNQPFRCDYGCNIHIGENFFANFNLTILDEAEVRIGDNCFIGPNVSIFTACHPLDAASRDTGVEWAEPVTIGDSVWIGDSKRGRRRQTWKPILCQQYETAGGTLFSKNRKRYAACFRRSKGFP